MSKSEKKPDPRVEKVAGTKVSLVATVVEVSAETISLKIGEDFTIGVPLAPTFVRGTDRDLEARLALARAFGSILYLQNAVQLTVEIKESP